MLSVFTPTISGDQDYEPQTIIAVNIDAIGLKEAKRLGLRLEEKVTLKNLNIEIVRFRTKSGIEKAKNILRKLQKGKSKASFDINQYYELAGNKKKCDDIRYYPLEIMNWPNDEFKGRGAKIGMIDTAVDTNAPFLADRNIITKSFVAKHDSASTEHGTAIASLLVGKANSHFPGLMPEASLYAASTFFVNKKGSEEASAITIAKALDWLVSKDVSVINMSLSGPQNRLLKKSVVQALQHDKVIVAAAGNNGAKAAPAYPAATKGVIAVTAVDRFKRHYHKANQGQYINYSAPGVGIWTPCADGRGRFRSGTSYAAACFTAMAAEQLNKPGMKQGHKALREVARKRALDLGTPGKDPIYGWGLVRRP